MGKAIIGITGIPKDQLCHISDSVIDNAKMEGIEFVELEQPVTLTIVEPPKALVQELPVLNTFIPELKCKNQVWKRKGKNSRF